ncbi:polysaccharide biosynthesis protein [Aphanothece hegewaldii]|uniref:polysaccharide biosynthesis protein n=1 Tax=Aphanothece hegewaldii TaxID=1521625 RepID=UPI001C637CF4|nr:polysaccharide biosynthesis protein [Aphanothece hegewaldii]
MVLVTGGEGCVGSNLVQKLISLGARRVISVDKARCANISHTQLIDDDKLVARYAVDIRNAKGMECIFESEKPEIVFHVAAQRLPGLAEIQVRETVTTNIFGTYNIIRLCEEYGVSQCVFSSTGKASRYFTAEVYAATKKMAEWLFARATAEGKVTYSLVRFTHLIDNSYFCQQYDDRIKENRLVNVHAPDRYILGQNISEALHLLLNALVFAQEDRLKILVCRNLGWPIETLEVALYKISQSGKKLPVYFQGVVPGYEETFFRGQVDWSCPHEFHLLLNVIESLTKEIDESGDLMICSLPPFSLDLLAQHLSILEDMCWNRLTEVQIKEALTTAIKDITRSIFAQTSPEVLQKIIYWGTDPKVKSSKIALNSHQDVLQLLFEGLNQALKQKRTDQRLAVPNVYYQNSIKQLAS